MARIHDLIRQLETKDPALAAEISREVRALSERRAFGLNFERHTPEQVELPGRPVRKGDKVHILPPRGEFGTKENKRIWIVQSISTGNPRIASLVAQTDSEQSCEIPVEDLVVVAEFRDPIYPGLVSTGKVERGGDKPFHTVINGENFHALEALLFTHRGKVDAIYIDPPYNTGARDWKYNNDYVESDDIYRHSKWLAFMERRLLLAKELLNPAESVLIVTIDEKEYLRLGLLLEQLFPDARVTMVSSVINSKGVARKGAFSRTDEYLYFVQFGNATPVPLPLGDEWRIVVDKRAQSIQWIMLNRSGTNARRVDRPNLFYPIFIRNTEKGPVFHSIGEPIGDSDRRSVIAPEGCVVRWPIRSDGSEGNWQISAPKLAELIADGFVRIGKWRDEQTTIEYTPSGEQAKFRAGLFKELGRRPDGSLIIDDSEYSPTFIPGSQWRIGSHNSSGSGGAGMIRSLIHPRTFPFPKSLYAVEDTLRFFVKSKTSAVIVDFFAGSGTTAHAVMRLNKQDGGRRRSISITNNEVGADEQKGLIKSGLRPGDVEWENHGICEYITKPRILSAATGKAPDGEPLGGSYKFTDEFPLSEGFAENVEFFTLTYEALIQISSGRAFERIAPLLWLRAGSTGRRIDSVAGGWDVADTYGVITDLDQSEKFAETIAKSPTVSHAFVFTDEDRLFEMVARQLPDHVEVVRMYDAYIRNAEIEAPGVAR